MKIGLLGFGTVGSGVFDIISNSKKNLLKNFEISKILVKTSRVFPLETMTVNPDDILNDKTIDLVVEAIGDIHPAYEYIIRALKSGKHVVSANKAVIAKYLQEFTCVAKENNVSFLCEASVGGGIPWLKSIKQAKRIDNIYELCGIFNGTSNFILYNMFANDYEFNHALKIAQENGYAESNPSADIDGIDIQRKLAISSSLAYNSFIPEENIPAFGIRNVTKDDIKFFKSRNMTLKLTAKSVLENSQYCCCVEPVLYDNNCVEANVSDNFNIGCLIGDSIGELKFYGQGAGKLPTANAIIQDIIDIYTGDVENYNYSFDKILKPNNNLISGRYYVRMKNEKAIEFLSGICAEKLSVGDYTVIITNEMSIDKAQSLFPQIAETDSSFFYARYN